MLNLVSFLLFSFARVFSWRVCNLELQLPRKSLFITCFKNSCNILSPQKDKEKEEKQLEEVIVTKAFVFCYLCNPLERLRGSYLVQT